MSCKLKHKLVVSFHLIVQRNKWKNRLDPRKYEKQPKYLKHMLLES